MFNTSLNNALTMANFKELDDLSCMDFSKAVDITSNLANFASYTIPFSGYMLYSGTLTNGVWLNLIYHMGMGLYVSQNNYASPFFACTKVAKNTVVAIPTQFFSYAGQEKCYLIPVKGV